MDTLFLLIMGYKNRFRCRSAINVQMGVDRHGEVKIERHKAAKKPIG
ncbi:hypothetical protein [Sphingobacterium sp.]|nr:hypothetical protein [Sphingobacterium sp.]